VGLILPLPKDGKCESCGETFSALWPVALLDETPYGAEIMIQKWYCYGCMEILWENWQEGEDGDEDEEDEEGSPDRFWWKVLS